jgi:8-oxo-dGTP diphosphatase
LRREVTEVKILGDRHARMADPIHVSAGILTRDGRILACRRRPDQPHAGKWEFPGGKREVGESDAECLRRELREELGIEAEVGAELWRTEHRYPGRTTVALVFFAVPRYRGVIENHAFAEIRWVEPAQLAPLDFLAADRALIDRLVRGDVAIS